MHSNQIINKFIKDEAYYYKDNQNLRKMSSIILNDSESSYNEELEKNIQVESKKISGLNYDSPEKPNLSSANYSSNYKPTPPRFSYYQN